jgi:HD superfamily phosphohydrolase
MITIQDPVHGRIELTVPEIRLVDWRGFQRLRHIKQLGFTEAAFPGATHSRYAHSLGAMQMASSIAESILPSLNLPADDAARLRQMLRLAALFHDLGHAPLSHVSERVMPPVAHLKLGDWVAAEARQATHEDYTLKLLVDSELTGLIEKHFGDRGLSGRHLAGLVRGCHPPGQPDAFVFAGRDLLPLLHQIVSGEVDADRMDYLRRDAYYCGVSYGQFDHLWLVRHLTAVPHEGRWTLALSHKGVWAFENFLLARYHMFLSVYYHHTAMCFDQMLGRFFDSGEYSLPAEAEAYLGTDDVHIWTALRRSKNAWAERIVARRPYALVMEICDQGDRREPEALLERLVAAGIDCFAVRKRALLSKYTRAAGPPLLLWDAQRDRISRIDEFTPLYRRFEDETAVTRVYCHPDQRARAESLR